MKKKLRYMPMAITIVIGVGAFLALQLFDIIPGPWSKDRLSLISSLQLEEAANTKDYMFYYRRGAVLAQQGQLEQAVAELNTAVQMRPTPLSLDALGLRTAVIRSPETHTLDMVVLLHRQRAEVLQRLNRPEDALADLDQALAFDNRKVEVFYQRGMLRLATGRYDDAVADFDTLLKTRDNANWYFSRAVAKYVQADWTGAIADFAAAAHMIPSNETYLIWLAKSYLRAGIAIPPESFAAMGPDSDARYVIQAFMSDYNPAQFMAGMRAGAAYIDRRRSGIQCETALFMGEWLTVRKKGVGAKDMFKEAAASCQPLSIEHAVAAAELKRLKL